MFGLIGLIIIGCLAGFIVGKIMRGGGFGFQMNPLLDIVGSVVGGWTLSLLNIFWGRTIGSLGTAVVGAVLLL